MGRRALEPGKFGKVTFRGKHPKLGLWRSEASLKQERVRPKPWRAEVRYHDPDQHRVRVLTAEGGTKGEAQDAIEDAMRQTVEAGGVNSSMGKATVGRAVRLHLEAMERGELNLSPGSVRTYGETIRSHMLHPRCQIRHIPLARVTALDIEGDMERMRDGGAYSRLRHYRAVMNAVMERAVKAKAITESPMRGVVMPSRLRTEGRKVYSNGAERRLNRALSESEEVALLEGLRGEPENIASLVLLMRSTGLRIAEAASLRVGDVDMAGGTLSVAGKLVRVKGEGLIWDPLGKSDLSLRTLPLRKGAREALGARLRAVRELDGAEYVFATAKAPVPDPGRLGQVLRGVFDRAGLKDLTPHALRRTVERELEQAGATVSERETFMGHTDRVARKHYADHGTLRPSIISALDQAGEKVE